MTKIQKRFWVVYMEIYKMIKNLDNVKKGKIGENIAKKYLISLGMTIICSNYRTKFGEIDIIARDRDYLVFIEVKYRRDEHEGDPAEAVDARKQARILRTARYYMTHYHISEDTPCRFDVVAVLGSNVRLIRDAFWCG